VDRICDSAGEYRGSRKYTENNQTDLQIAEFLCQVTDRQITEIEKASHLVFVFAKQHKMVV